MLHARNFQTNTLDPILGGDKLNPIAMMDGIAKIAAEQNKSPQQMRPGAGILSPGMAGAQKGIIGSQRDERNFVNNLYQTNESNGNQWRAGGPMNANNVPVIGEESSNNGDGMQPRNTRN